MRHSGLAGCRTFRAYCLATMKVNLSRRHMPAAGAALLVDRVSWAAQLDLKCDCAIERPRVVREASAGEDRRDRLSCLSSLRCALDLN